MNAGTINGKQIDASIQGSGSILASGNVLSLHAKTNGSGSINMSTLRTQSAYLTTNGSGDISATVLQNVAAHSSGSGQISVYGKPLQRDIQGKHVMFVN